MPTVGRWSRQLLVCLYRADVPANFVSSIISLLILDGCLGYYQSTNLRFIQARPTLSLSFIHQPLIFNIGALVGPSFIDQSLLSQCWTDNQVTLDQPIFNFLKLRYTGAPVVGTPILGTHYIVSCDAEVCGAERESSIMIQVRMHWAVYFALLCYASGATLG